MINGKFLYASNTRPDISYAVGQICKFQTRPSKELENAICRLISYLNGRPNEEIKFVRPASFDPKLMTVDLSAFYDAAFADQYDRRSTYGYLVFLCSNLISWCSKTTPSVKLSSTDAEYYALAEVTKEIMYLKQLLETLGLMVKTPILIYEDNQQAIDIANNLMIKSRTKHIDIKLHFIRRVD